VPYADRLRDSGVVGADADRRLREFASKHGLNIEESDASLKVRGPDRRSVVLQPSPGGGVGTAGLRIQFHHVPTEDADRLRTAVREAGGQPESIYSFVSLEGLTNNWDKVETTVLEPFFEITTDGTSFEIGDRVRLRRPVDRYPHTLVPEGATGVVTSASASDFRTRLDAPVLGLDEWNNEVHWDSESEAAVYLEPIVNQGADEMAGQTMEARVLDAIHEFGSADDDELAARLGVIRQHVNQAARRLAARGELTREIGPNGKLTNSLPSRSPT
jgi:hypothetical protein